MPKAPLYYAIRSYGWRKGEIIGVTSENDRKWSGRVEPYKISTHGNKSGYNAPVGRFPTYEAALEARDTIEHIKRDHLARITLARQKFQDAERAERDEIEAYVRAIR